MRILHYFLGFPPYRSGGLTLFCFNLMEAQVKNGHSVFGMWPGEIRLFNHNPFIRKHKCISGIMNFELVNPLPVPLDEGICDIDKFTASCDKNVYIKFLKSTTPNAIHIHTLMGLHKEFVEAANDLKIKTIFTTHDYFGICPKVTLFRNDNVCNYDHDCMDCVSCNKTALSYKKIVFLQSHLYKSLKNSLVIKKLRQKHRREFFEETFGHPEEIISVSEEDAKRYQKLRNFYTNILEMIDVIHFNSSVSENVYRKYIIPKNSVLLSISNKEIGNNTNLEKSKSDKVRFTFLSSAKQFKGYSIVKNTFDKLWQEGNRNFILKLYTIVPKVEPYMEIHERGFRRDELTEIFADTDYLLAPSVWYETFGFTVLEALSYGVPVIVSDHVGAGMVAGDGGIVVPAGSEAALREAVLSMTAEKCVAMRQRIRDHVDVKTWNTYVAENQTMYTEAAAR